MDESKYSLAALAVFLCRLVASLLTRGNRQKKISLCSKCVLLFLFVYVFYFFRVKFREAENSFFAQKTLQEVLLRRLHRNASDLLTYAKYGIL